MCLLMFLEGEKLAREKGRLKSLAYGCKFLDKIQNENKFFHRRPYVSEPYNKDYYLKLFLNNGYEIQENTFLIFTQNLQQKS